MDTSPDEKRRVRHSYRAYVAIAFAVVAAATAIAIIAIIATVFNIYFATYAGENLSALDIAFRDNTYHALIVAGIVATLVATIVGIVFSRILTQPIKRISAVAKELSRGNLSARTGMTGENEIEQLGETFDVMADSLERDRNHELRLTSDVAHELRTPLMAIQAMVEAMIDGVYETDEEHLALVESEVERLSRMVDALLELSRLEARGRRLEKELCNLGEVVEQVVSSHKVFVHDSGLELNLHVDDDVEVNCNKDLVRQAIANLISNSVRYTPEGGCIDVYVHHDGKWGVVDVKDTGIGLSPDEAKMVFERFWRADSGRGRKSGGLGIGLSVVREIVSQHDGEIEVHGKEGEGAMFTVKLPAVRVKK